MPWLEHLRPGEILDRDVWARHTTRAAMIKGRLCAVRCRAEAHQRAERRARRAAVCHQHTTQDAPLRSSAFIIVFTTLSRQWPPAHDVLTLYRNAWQAKLVFKRLKELV